MLQRGGAMKGGERVTENYKERDYDVSTIIYFMKVWKQNDFK